MAKSMRYDHPEYTVTKVVASDIAAGSAALGAKYVAFATTLLKSATIMVTTAGTTTAAAANTYTFSKVNGTATTSVGFSGNLGTTVAFTQGTQVSITGTLSTGEMLVAKRGTDATAACSITYEFLTSPGADITS